MRTGNPPVLQKTPPGMLTRAGFSVCMPRAVRHGAAAFSDMKHRWVYVVQFVENKENIGCIKDGRGFRGRI